MLDSCLRSHAALSNEHAVSSVMSICLAIVRNVRNIIRGGFNRRGIVIHISIFALGSKQCAIGDCRSSLMQSVRIIRNQLLTVIFDFSGVHHLSIGHSGWNIADFVRFTIPTSGVILVHGRRIIRAFSSRLGTLILLGSTNEGALNHLVSLAGGPSFNWHRGDILNSAIPTAA
jgi:hypothetical protein